MADLGGLGEDDVLDLVHFFDNILPEDLDDFFDYDDDSSSIPNPNPNPNHCLSIGEIENFLLVDDLEDRPNSNQSVSATDAFLSDIILDSPPPSSLDSGPTVTSHNHNHHHHHHHHHHDHDLSSQFGVNLDSSKNSSPSNPQDKDEHNLVLDQEDNHVGDVVDDGDPLSKKRKRQLRNRDAAVRSRERKKIYVKDLEMKSRFYEAECRRLGMLLQCCLAEYHALRYSLHNNNNGQAFGASMTKQESAVLLLESLLLGSLLWFLGVIGLFILPRQFLLILKAAPLENMGEKNQASLSPGKPGSKITSRIPALQSFMMSKRWRGSRTRMKVLYQWL